MSSAVKYASVNEATVYESVTPTGKGKKPLNKILPGTYISSGDNESFSHPRAGAVGCAGKYSKSARPLVFSTELARATNLKNKKTLYGMINCRCNGQKIYTSQMKEAHTNLVAKRCANWERRTYQKLKYPLRWAR